MSLMRFLPSSTGPSNYQKKQKINVKGMEVLIAKVRPMNHSLCVCVRSREKRRRHKAFFCYFDISITTTCTIAGEIIVEVDGILTPL